AGDYRGGPSSHRLLAAIARGAERWRRRQVPVCLRVAIALGRALQESRAGDAERECGADEKHRPLSRKLLGIVDELLDVLLFDLARQLLQLIGALFNV